MRTALYKNHKEFATDCKLADATKNYGEAAYILNVFHKVLQNQQMPQKLLQHFAKGNIIQQVYLKGDRISNKLTVLLHNFLDFLVFNVFHLVFFHV